MAQAHGASRILCEARDHALEQYQPDRIMKQSRADEIAPETKARAFPFRALPLSHTWSWAATAAKHRLVETDVQLALDGAVTPAGSRYRRELRKQDAIGVHPRSFAVPFLPRHTTAVPRPGLTAGGGCIVRMIVAPRAEIVVAWNRG